MFKVSAIFLTFIFSLALLSSTAYAAIYVKIEGLSGDVKAQSTDGQSGDWIEIESFSYRAGQAEQNTTGAARRRAAIKPIDALLIKPVDASTPQLFNAVTKGMVFPKIIIKHQENAQLYITTMINVQVTNIKQVSKNGAWPREHISFTYQKIIWDYSDDKNKTKASWDVKGGR